MAREKVAKRARVDSDAEANLDDEVREYIARLSSEKNEESKQLYKAEQRHQIMADGRSSSSDEKPNENQR